MQWHAWTESAIDCYKRGGKCKGCPTKAILETKCTMKQTVIELVRQYGRPPDNPYFDWATESQNKVITAIIEGHTTLEDISTATGVKWPGKQILSALPYFREMGFEANSYKTKTVDLIRYIAEKYGTCTKINEKNSKNKNGENKMYLDEDLKVQYPEKYCYVMEAIKKGYTTQADIARESGMKAGSIWFTLERLASFFKLSTTEVSAKTALIDFVQKRLVDVHRGEAEDITTETLPQITAAEPPKVINAQHVETEEAANPKMETQYIDTIAALKAENEELKAKIAELEKDSTLSAIKQKIKDKLRKQKDKKNKNDSCKCIFLICTKNWTRAKLNFRILSRHKKQSKI